MIFFICFAIAGCHIGLQHTPRRQHAQFQTRIQNFDRGGANNSQVSTLKYLMPLVFKASSIKGAIFWSFLFWIIMFRFKPAIRTPVCTELTSFENLFLEKFQASTSDKSHHFLARLSWKSACENPGAINARSAACFLQPILPLSKKP